MWEGRLQRLKRKKKFGAEERYPSLPQVVLAQLGAMVAGELAGARGKFGRLGDVMEVALETNQETAAKLINEQNQERQQLARDRRDINQIATRLKLPNQLISPRAIDDP